MNKKSRNPLTKFPDDIDPAAAENLLDMLLLAVIRGNNQHPIQENDYERLKNAKRALFGISKGRGKWNGRDMPELLEMARRYIKIQGRPQLGLDYELIWENQAVGIETSIARAVLEEKYAAKSVTVTDDTKAQRVRLLQKKFNKDKSNLLKIVYHQEGMLDDVFMGHLAEIEALLKRMGFEVRRPFDVNRDLVR